MFRPVTISMKKLIEEQLQRIVKGWSIVRSGTTWWLEQEEGDKPTFYSTTI